MAIDNIVFDDEHQDAFRLPLRQHGGMAKALVKMGLVSSLKNATTILAVVAFIFVVGTVYLIVSSAPSQPVLGADVLRPGERVPAYLNSR